MRSVCVYAYEEELIKEVCASAIIAAASPLADEAPPSLMQIDALADPLLGGWLMRTANAN